MAFITRSVGTLENKRATSKHSNFLFLSIHRDFEYVRIISFAKVQPCWIWENLVQHFNMIFDEKKNLPWYLDSCWLDCNHIFVIICPGGVSIFGTFDIRRTQFTRNSGKRGQISPARGINGQCSGPSVWQSRRRLYSCRAHCKCLQQSLLNHYYFADCTKNEAWQHCGICQNERRSSHRSRSFSSDRCASIQVHSATRPQKRLPIQLLRHYDQHFESAPGPGTGARHRRRHAHSQLWKFLLGHAVDRHETFVPQNSKGLRVSRQEQVDVHGRASRIGNNIHTRVHCRYAYMRIYALHHKYITMMKKIIIFFFPLWRLCRVEWLAIIS